MDYIKLGRTEITVSRLCFGCAAIGGYDYGPVEDSVSIRAIRCAIDCGVTFFDVADVYGFGRAETVLGKALGPSRGRTVIATKFGVAWQEGAGTRRDLNPTEIEKALDASLARLGTDYVDLYQIHWPDHITPLGAVAAELERLKSKGKLLAFGCCNFSEGMVRDLQIAGGPDSIQMPFSLVERQFHPLLICCAEKMRLTTMTYNTLAQGLFSGKYDKSSSFIGSDLRRRSTLFAGETFTRNLRVLESLKRTSKHLGKTPAQIAIRWVLKARGIGCAIVGAKTENQVLENVGAFEWDLDPSEHALLAGEPLV